jgi:glycerol dehydrogenase-like iron-containing ADH family enzyme
MSHYWEMSHLAYGTPAPSHGISAGIGLIYTLVFHDILKNVDVSKLSKDKIKSGRMTRDEKFAFLKEYFPGSVGEEVTRVNKYWYLEWPEHERRIDSIAAYHEQYKADCAILPEYRDIAKTYELFGAPPCATKAGIDMELLRKTLICTKDFRARYSCATALYELGMIEESVERVLEIEKTL